MVTTAVAASNTGVRIVVSAVFWCHNAVIPKRRRNKSWQPIMSDRVCAGFNASLVSAHKPLLIGSKKDERNPALKATLAPAQPEDILELDEVWSFVLSKAEKRWLWTAMCRRTRQIVAFVIGDRSEVTCRLLWQAIPDEYKLCQTYSDFWETYANVFQKKRTTALAKRVVKPIIWSAGTIRSGNGMRVMSARRYPFRKLTSFTAWSPDYSLFATISTNYHLLLEHYR